MTKQQGIGALLGICALMIVLSLAGLASDFITHLLGNIDGLLLFAICVMIAGLFALMLFQMAKEEGWIPARHKAADATPAPAAAKPAAKSGAPTANPPESVASSK